MDRLFKKMVTECTPEMNADIVNGLAVKMLPYAEQYLDDVFRAASRSLPPQLKYIGCQRATPLEEFRYNTNGHNGSSRRIGEVSRNDIYLMKYFFEYTNTEIENNVPVEKKEIITRFIHLPFVGEGGGLYVRGKKYFIHPIMTDKVINPHNQTIFIRLMRDRIIFHRSDRHSVYMNNRKYNCAIISATLYRNKSKKNGKTFLRLSKANTTMVNYLLGKFGFDEFFNRYFGFVPEVGEYTQGMEEEGYILFRSTGLKPKTVVQNAFSGVEYKPSNLYIKIPEDKSGTLINDIITGIFYIIDHFPHLFEVEYLKDPRVWQQCLGYIIFNGNNSTGKIMDGIHEHYNSLDEYVDEIVIRKLKEEGYDCKNFYDLLILVIKNFSFWLNESNKNINTMYGKELSILYPVFYPLTRKLFNTAFTLNKTSLKKNLSLKEVTEIMNKNLISVIVYDLPKPDAPTSTINYCGDNKFFKITSVIIPQATNISGESKAKKKRVSEKDNIIFGGVNGEKTITIIDITIGTF